MRLSSPGIYKLIIPMLVSLVMPFRSAAQSTEELFELSLEELLNVRITTGQLFDVRQQDSPSAVTVIQQNQIELAPVKNLAELLEMYVPGLLLMTHSEGDKLGLRGNIAAENYKLLILINGKNITNMVYEGVINEIDQWDLTDIERVEVVRGPGSVVYGTGAIAGVINIIPKSGATTSNANSVIGQFNTTYHSRGFSLQKQFSGEKSRGYFFGSFRNSNGLQNPDYYVQRGDINVSNNRFVGKGDGYEYGPQPYKADAFDRPQVKLHLDWQYSERFNLFARYTQSGQTHHFRTLSPVVDNSNNVINTVPNRQVSLRSFIFAPEYLHQLTERSRFKAAFTYDTQEYLRYEQANIQWPADHPNNARDYAFSQNRWHVSGLYIYEASEWNVTSGYEFEFIDVTAPWGENKEHLLIREGVYMINDFSTSVYTQDLSLRNRPRPDRVVEVGSGIDFYKHSLLFEGNYNLSEKTQLHYGHRLDFPNRSSTMSSMRFAVQTKPKEGHSVTLTAQHALRMMPLRAQYLNDIADKPNDNEHEKIDSIELAYTNSISRNGYITGRAFYNDIDAVGFTGEELQFLGNLKLVGIEAEFFYKTDSVDLQISHSYLSPNSVTMSDELKDGTNRNNLSYADYFYITRTEIPITLESTGNGINNWSENTSKFVVTKTFLDNALTVQINGQIFWDYKGSYDEVHMYQKAYDNFDQSQLTSEQQLQFNSQLSIFERERQLMDERDAYQTQFILGLSVTYSTPLMDNTEFKSSFYIQNLFDSRKRYFVNTGSSNFYTNRMNFIEEPTVYGVNFEFSF